MGTPPNVKYRQIITLSVILLLCASPVLLTDGHRVRGTDGDADDHAWNVTVTQSNESWPVLLVYDSLLVFYQNLFLDCTIDPRISEHVNLTDNESAICISAMNGVFNVSHPSEWRQFEWLRWNEAEEIDKEGIATNSIHLKPQEHDSNFPMIFSITIQDGSNSTLYTETHTYLIIGEPIIIEKEKLESGVGIVRTYLISLVVSFAILGFFLVDRRITGRDT